LGGLGDALDVYNAWMTGATLEYFGTNYLKQFYQVCKDFGAEGFVILASPGEYSCHHVPGFTLEHRPPPSYARLSGIRYHLAFNVWMVKIVLRMLRFRPDVFIVTAGIAYCLPLSILKLFGVRIIPAIHDSLWRRFSKLKLSSRIIRRSQAWFFRCCASEFLVAAESTAAQVRSLIPKKNIRIEIFLPNYSKEQFSSIREPNFDLRPFREVNKGVYDILKVAENLEPGKFHFDICGVGSESNSLQRAIDARGLAEAVSYHGFLNRKDLCKLWDHAHIVIVPTTIDFEEGFNMVCSEAILAGRPVVTSDVCPALAYINNAAIEVRPNDVDGYRKAVIALASDRALYHEKQAACRPLQAQFYEEKNSYGAKLTTILEGLSLRNDRKPDLGLNSELPVMSQIPSVHPQAPLEKT
jgi:glycogen synthase